MKIKDLALGYLKKFKNKTGFFTNSAEDKKLKDEAVRNNGRINQIMPNEMLTEMLTYLDEESLKSAKLTCEHWKKIVMSSKELSEKFESYT